MRSQSYRSVTHLKKASAAFLSQPEVVLEVGILPVVRPSAPSRYCFERSPGYSSSKLRITIGWWRTSRWGDWVEKRNNGVVSRIECDGAPSDVQR